MEMPSRKRSKSKSRKGKKRSKSGSRKRSKSGKRKMSRKGSHKYKSTKILQYVWSREGLGGNKAGFPSRAAIIAALKKSSTPEEDYVKRAFRRPSRIKILPA
jgi:hypothetical protein